MLLLKLGGGNSQRGKHFTYFGFEPKKMTKYVYEFVIFREEWNGIRNLLTWKENEDYLQKLRGFWTTFLLIKRLDNPFKNTIGVNRRKNSSHLSCHNN